MYAATWCREEVLRAEIRQLKVTRLLKMKKRQQHERKEAHAQEVDVDDNDDVEKMRLFEETASEYTTQHVSPGRNQQRSVQEVLLLQLCRLLLRLLPPRYLPLQYCLDRLLILDAFSADVDLVEDVDDGNATRSEDRRSSMVHNPLDTTSSVNTTTPSTRDQSENVPYVNTTNTNTDTVLSTTSAANTDEGAQGGLQMRNSLLVDQPPLVAAQQRDSDVSFGDSFRYSSFRNSFRGSMSNIDNHNGSNLQTNHISKANRTTSLRSSLHRKSLMLRSAIQQTSSTPSTAVLLAQNGHHSGYIADNGNDHVINARTRRMHRRAYASGRFLRQLLPTSREVVLKYVTDVAVFLTYGLLFPPMAGVVCFAVLVDVYMVLQHWRRVLSLWGLVEEYQRDMDQEAAQTDRASAVLPPSSMHMGNDKNITKRQSGHTNFLRYQTILLTQTTVTLAQQYAHWGIDGARVLQHLLGLLVCGFWCFVLFDTLGGLYSYTVTVVVVTLTCTMPIWLWIMHVIFAYTRSTHAHPLATRNLDRTEDEDGSEAGFDEEEAREKHLRYLKWLWWWNGEEETTNMPLVAHRRKTFSSMSSVQL